MLNVYHPSVKIDQLVGSPLPYNEIASQDLVLLKWIPDGPFSVVLTFIEDVHNLIKH